MLYISCVNKTLAVSVRGPKRTDNLLLKDKKKLNNAQPSHKTAHLQVPTHKTMLQLAKEQFSFQRTAGN
jgi:hypothetical protein